LTLYLFKEHSVAEFSLGQAMSITRVIMLFVMCSLVNSQSLNA